VSTIAVADLLCQGTIITARPTARSKPTRWLA